MYNGLMDLYELDGCASIRDLTNGPVHDTGAGDHLHDVFQNVMKICENDFESVSELNSHISGVVTDLYNYNEDLHFNEPVKEHIPVVIALIKSIACFEIGRITAEVQNNNKATTQLYGLALDHILQANSILSILDIDSLFFKNITREYLKRFMDSYSGYANLEKMHSSIMLKHHLLDLLDTDDYTGEIHSSIGHGYYSIYSTLSDLSPGSKWMPFSTDYLVEQCVRAHKKAFDMDGAGVKNDTAKYYIQSMRLHIESLLASRKRSMKIFFELGNYRLARETAKSLIEQCEAYGEQVRQFKEYRSLEKHVEDFESMFNYISEKNYEYLNISTSCLNLLEDLENKELAGKEDATDLEERYDHGLPGLIVSAINKIPEDMSDEQKKEMTELLIHNVSDIFSLGNKELLKHTNNSIKNDRKASSSKEFYQELLDTTQSLEELGIKLWDENEKDIPDTKELTEPARDQLRFINEILNEKVLGYHLIDEISKILGFKYDRVDLISCLAIRGLISINEKMQYIDTFFDDVEDDRPVTLTLRFKCMETITKTLAQTKIYKDENELIDILIQRYNGLKDTMLIFCTRDEANIYEYSESVRIFYSLIKEVLSDSNKQESKDISEYVGYVAFDRNFGWENFLDKAYSLKKASIIHKHAFEFLVENDNTAMAKQALQSSKKCEAEYYLLCALYYESRKNGEHKADEMYTRSIEAYAQADIESAVKAITARKFWLRDKNKSHYDL